MTSLSIKDIHPKGWGYEHWIVNNEKYCGKLLFFNEGKSCSFHYHKVKDETFYLQSGCILVYYSDYDDLETANQLLLAPGDSMHIYPGLRHKMFAIMESELFEFSTQHMEEDSIRIVRGD